ncbi:chemotaxis protein CheC [Silvimonas sp. JCM 19000]
MNIVLTELQKETLEEVFNIGMGRAAAALSTLVNEEVTLSIPSVRLMQRKEAALVLGGTGRRVCSITQVLRGEFGADAILIFPEEKSLQLVRLMLGESVDLTFVSEIEREALTEVGNIILNACIGTITNLLEGEFSISLPVFKQGDCVEIMQGASDEQEQVVMLLHIDFSVEKYEISGHVAFVQDVRSYQGFVERIERFIQKAMRS